MNGTFRELEQRILAFRARTGGDYSSVWISHERWQLLPEGFRLASIRSRLEKRSNSASVIAGVPVNIIQVLAPGEGQRHFTWV